MKRNIKTYDNISWASKEELEVYKWLKDGSAAKWTGIDELKGAKLLDPRPKAFPLFGKFMAGAQRVLSRRYTADFEILLADGTTVILEYKSKFTEGKPDYRLRRSIFLFFYRDKINFAELIKIKKGDYIFKKYY